MGAGATYRRDGDLIEIVFHRPERRNALGAAEWAVLDAAIAEAEQGVCEMVVLRGEGAVFCGGVDLDWIRAQSERSALLKLIEDNGETLRRLDRLPQLVIVALNGPAIGIGTHLALCGDIVLATRTTYLCVPEARLGIPDVLHVGLLEQRLGRSTTIDMVLLGQRLTAEEARIRGIFGHVYEHEEALQSAVADYLRRLREVNPAVRRAALSATKRATRADTAAQLEACTAVMNSRANK
jgi:enoyl-CoA hydratase/carnithine racemase